MSDPDTPEPAAQTLPPIDPTAGRRTRLLAGFLLVLIAVFGVVDGTGLLTVPGYSPPWYGYVFLVGAWLLNRSGRYTAAAAVTLTMFPVVLLSQILGGSTRPELTLGYLAPGVLLASILLAPRGTVLFAASSLALVLATPWLVPAGVASPRLVVMPLALVAITAGLAVVSTLHRDRLERDRQAELRESEERLRLALEAAHTATWEWDVQSDRARWSDGAAAVLGDPPGGPPATGRAYLEMVHPDDRDATIAAIQAAIEGRGRRYTLRHRVTSGDGPVRWLEAQGRVDRDAHGAAVRTRGAILDVTDRQRAEAEREALIRELEAKNAELERFTYTVSHDLKSPLVTIRGFLGLVAKDVAEGKTHRLAEDVERMVNATDAMQHLLHELLRLSRIGRVVNPFERVAFAAIAREAGGIVRAQLEQRGVRLEIDEDLPEVCGDRLRLVEAVQNLLENAAKFTGESASPVVRVGSRPGAGGGPPELFVRDNGLGIDPRFHEKVFGLFEQLDPRAEGTGVGLALVKRIVETHGGRVWIESEGRGHGTTVCFTLPPPPPA